MTSSPFLSVVIPTFHRNESLSGMLDLLKPGVQTLGSEQYEVIVSDAGTGSTAQRMVEERYPWVRWVAAPGCSPGVNRNKGAAVAVGEWLVFVDDDCRIESGFLAGYYAMAKENAFDVLEGRITCREKVNSPFRRQLENLNGGIVITGNLAMRREVFFRVGPFDSDLRIAEDLELAERLRASKARIGFCPAATVDHPSQPTGWKHFWKHTFHRRWFVLYRYKINANASIQTALWLSLVKTTWEEILFTLRISWHLFSQHDPTTWRFQWFWVLWSWICLPVLLPVLWFWEIQFRKLIRSQVMVLRPVPQQAETSC